MVVRVFRLGRPSLKLSELARSLGCTVEAVAEAQEAAASYAASSLDAPIASDDADSASLIDLLGDDDSAYDLVAEREAIATTWRRLPDDERQAVELRFMHNLTQSEIGQRMGCSQMQVSRVLRRALAGLEVARPPERPGWNAAVSRSNTECPRSLPGLMRGLDALLPGEGRAVGPEAGPPPPAGHPSRERPGRRESRCLRCARGGPPVDGGRSRPRRG